MLGPGKGTSRIPPLLMRELYFTQQVLGYSAPNVLPVSPGAHSAQLVIFCHPFPPSLSALVCTVSLLTWPLGPLQRFLVCDHSR
jgi:hypothetical protein